MQVLNTISETIDDLANPDPNIKKTRSIWTRDELSIIMEILSFLPLTIITPLTTWEKVKIDWNLMLIKIKQDPDLIAQFEESHVASTIALRNCFKGLIKAYGCDIQRFSCNLLNIFF
jgi:hypothetical protein